MSGQVEFGEVVFECAQVGVGFAPVGAVVEVQQRDVHEPNGRTLIVIKGRGRNAGRGSPARGLSVGGDDYVVLDLNRQAEAAMHCETKLEGP